MDNEIKPVMVVQSPLFTRSGYGAHALDIVRCLHRWDKYDLKIVPTRWGGCPQLNLDEMTKTDAELRQLLGKVLSQPLTEQPEVFIQITIPNEFQTPAKFNIGITAGIETTLPRGEWLEGLNRMNYNIVPSTFTKSVFSAVKYKKKDQQGRESDLAMEKPMDVIFEGADTDIYKKNAPKEPEIEKIFEGIKEDFVFLFVGHWLQGELGEDRKNVGRLVRTFSEVFKNRPDAPALVMKTSGAGFSVMDRQEMLKKIKHAQSTVVGKVPNVYLVHGDLTDKEMNALYNHSKVKAHVSFTKGEGFGRPLLEASLSGKPVIAPAWSGHCDFLNKDLAVLLPGELTPVHPSTINDWIIENSKWFSVNNSVAAKVLNDVFTNYDKYLPNAEKLRKENAEKFSLKAMEKVLIETLEKAIPAFPTRKKLVLPKFKKKEPTSTPEAQSAATP
jgi:glycosyltransferase involved in cell wall biosynthesis